MPFLLIGGHAVNVYGVQRQTGDIDLIVKSSQRKAWEDLFLKIRYQSDQSDSRFIRYRPDTIAAWPIDLMLVDDETSDCAQATRPQGLSGTSIREGL